MTVLSVDGAQGVAIIIAAVAAAVVTIGGFILQVLTFNASQKAITAGVARDLKLDTIGHAVDGLSDAKAEAAKELGLVEGHAAGTIEGHAAGVLAERTDPHSLPPPDVPAKK